MNNILSHCFTIYGEVYVGEEVFEPAFPNHIILIQRSALKSYLELKEKTLEQIERFGWALPRNVIANHLKVDSTKHFDELRKKQGEEWQMTYDRSTMFIVGAGASANCISWNHSSDFKKSESRPPCGPELFDKRFERFYRKYPGVLQSLKDLQGEGSIDVESLFEEEWQEISQYGNEQVVARHINIQYYLQELLKHVSFATWNGYGTYNLYARLADRLQKLSCRNKNRKYAFVSFNQDTILEYFLKRYFNFELNCLRDYVNINNDPISIFKPHGSWNWGWRFGDRETRSISMADWLFQNKINLHKIYYEMLGSYQEMVDWSSYGINYRHNENSISKFNVSKDNLSVIYPDNENMYFPALLMPYRDKDEFTMPSSHYWNLHHYLSHVETLIIIGWKGNERLFNQLLNKAATKIKRIIIADPYPKTIEDQLHFLKERDAEIITYTGGFEEFIEKGLDREFPLMTV
jgi:hypothetical protein